MLVVKTTPVREYGIRLIFEDGFEGDVDIASFVEFTGVFEPLRDPDEFAKVNVVLAITRKRLFLDPRRAHAVA